MQAVGPLTDYRGHTILVGQVLEIWNEGQSSAIGYGTVTETGVVYTICANPPLVLVPSRNYNLMLGIPYYHINNGDGRLSVMPSQGTISAVGDYIVQVRAADTLGNVSAVTSSFAIGGSTTFTQGANNFDLTAAPNPAAAGQTITVTSDVIDTSDNMATVATSFGTITDSDEDPLEPGIQRTLSGGRVTFHVTSAVPGQGGVSARTVSEDAVSGNDPLIVFLAAPTATPTNTPIPTATVTPTNEPTCPPHAATATPEPATATPVLVTMTPTFVPSPTSTPVSCLHTGDANSDGLVTPSDAQRAFQYYLGCHSWNPTIESYCAADFCGSGDISVCDGSVTPADAQGIMRLYLGYAQPCAKRNGFGGVRPLTVTQSWNELAGAIDVAVGVSGIGQEISAFGFQLSFDPARLRFIEVTRGKLDPNWEFFDARLSAPGLITVGGASLHGIEPAVSGDFVIARFAPLGTVDTEKVMESVLIDEFVDDLQGARVK